MADRVDNIAIQAENDNSEWSSRLRTRNASTGTNTSAGTVIARIESILDSICQHLVGSQELSIEMASRTYIHQADPEGRHERIRFPGRTPIEARKFTRVLLILQLAHDALVSGTVLTKRHVFYQHQDLFETQRNVDELVDDLALSLGVHRDDLNIVAAAKGLISGPLTIGLQDGSAIHASRDDMGVLIPSAKMIASLDFGPSRWVLVVEKDTVFRSLCSSQFWQSSTCGPGVLVTAKGYPDLITRSFLHLAHADFPQLPIFVLVDYDPDGLNIFRCYRYAPGRSAVPSSAENAGMHWLGIKSSNLLNFETVSRRTQSPVQEEMRRYHHDTQTGSGRTSNGSIASTACREPVSQLTARDRKSAISTLSKVSKVSPQDNEAAELQRELQVMLIMGVKAEIQWLDDSGDIVEWLDQTLAAAISTMS